MKLKIGNITLTPTTNQAHSAWLKARNLSIGGSDMGTLFNLNEYNSVTQLFYEKLGRTAPADLSENSSVHYGSAFEDVVLRDSQYLNIKGKPNNHIKNYSKGNKIASHVPFPYTITSSLYPQIAANIDGMGFYDKNITEQDLIDMVESGVMPIPDKIIEIKTMSESARDKWKDGMNPTYPIQVRTYCLPFLELNPKIYGEIYVFAYDKSMTGHRVELSSKDKEMIPLVSKKFQTLIEEGRKIIKEGKKMKLSDDEIDEMLSQIHPEPNSSATSLGTFLSDNFLKKQYIRENATIKGTEEDINNGLRSGAIGKEIKVLNSEKTQISNNFKNKLVINKARVIDCAEHGKISYSKRLTINIK